ncbi:MAG: type II toxin-antitoxin system VapC family toxin [Cyanobium sp.]
MAARQTTRLVLDASAVVRIIEGSSQACAFTEALETAELVLAPELMLTEVANTLWRIQGAGQLQAATLQARLRRAADLVDHIEPDRTLQAEALALATHLDHPVYDCLYLVLARREVASLLSADQRLLDLGRKVLP